MSWSGTRSRQFAEVLKPWPEQVLPGTDVWLSSVICITRENHLSPWIHFEAGGMLKGLGKKHVATILLDIDYAELQQPLNQFNGLRLNRVGAWHLVKSFNAISDRPIKDRVLERTFEKFWPDLDDDYRLMFPDSHESASLISEPLHIVPGPTEGVLGSKSPPKPRKRRPQDKPQPTLFNGEQQ